MSTILKKKPGGALGSLSSEKTIELRRRAAAGEKKAVLAREYGVSRQTVYSCLRQQAS